MLILPSMYQSTILGTSVRPRAPPNAVPFHTQPENDDARTGLHLGGVDDRADAGGDAAADVADLVEGRIFADFRDRDLGQDGEIGEGGATHVVMHGLATQREATGAIGHHAFA